MAPRLSRRIRHRKARFPVSAPPGAPSIARPGVCLLEACGNQTAAKFGPLFFGSLTFVMGKGRCRGATMEISQTRQCLVSRQTNSCVLEGRRDFPCPFRTVSFLPPVPGTLCRANIQRRSATAESCLEDFTHNKHRPLWFSTHRGRQKGTSPVGKARLKNCETRNRPGHGVSLPLRSGTQFVRHVTDGKINERPNAGRKHPVSRIKHMDRQFPGLPFRQHADEFA